MWRVLLWAEDSYSAGAWAVAIFGSGGLIAIFFQYLKSRSDAKVNEAIRLAELANDEKVRVAEAASAEEKSNLKLQLQALEYKVSQLQSTLDSRAEAANTRHEQQKVFILQLQSEIDRLRKLDKEHRVTMRDEIVMLREENERLKGRSKDHEQS